MQPLHIAGMATPAVEILQPTLNKWPANSAFPQGGIQHGNASAEAVPSAFGTFIFDMRQQASDFVQRAHRTYTDGF